MDDIAQEIEALGMEKKPEKGTQGNKTAQNAAAAPEESNEKEDTLEDEVKDFVNDANGFNQ